MKPLKNPKKTIKVLYLYMTLPLLLVAGTLWVTTSFYSSDEYVAEPAPEKAAKAHEPLPFHSKPRTCLDDTDCRVGEHCHESGCINHLRTSREPHMEPQESPPADDGISSAGWAAIIASIMGGLTGLLGAITQTVLAFLAMRRRRRSRD